MTHSAYELSKLIPALHGKYTEEELAIRFKLTISDVRQYLKGPIPLTSAAWGEIIAMHPEASNYALTKLYNTSNNQVKKWAEGNGRDKVIMSPIEIQELLDQGKSVKEVSKLANVTMEKVAKILPKVKRQMPSKKQLLAMEGTHEEIANYLGVSRSWVTKQLSEKRKPSTPYKVKDWNAVEEYLKANSLTATAKHFGVTLSAISHWRKRNVK